MSNTTNLIDSLIAQQLLEFIMDTKCCQEFSRSFRDIDHSIFIKYSVKYGLKIRQWINDGIPTVKAYKQGCSHYITEAPALNLPPQISKNLFQIVSQRTDFMIDDFDMADEKPTTHDICFSTNAFKHTFPKIEQLENLAQTMYTKDVMFKELFLTTLSKNNVLLINGEFIHKKSVAIPMYILEYCARKNEHCKIICIQREAILAIIHSHKLAYMFGETVGLTSSFQVHLQSRISESSIVIYTTGIFFLRVLMKGNKSDVFDHVSHIVIDDADMHNPFSDLLLTEIKEAIEDKHKMKVILLSSSAGNAEFINYFGEGEELESKNLDCNGISAAPNIIYLNEIRQLTSKRSALLGPLGVSKSMLEEKASLNELYLHYEENGSDEAFRSILSLIHHKNAVINYQEPIHQNTVSIIAAQHGNINHLRTLLELYADPYIENNDGLNAIMAAHKSANKDCIELMKAYCNSDLLRKSMDPTYLDYMLLLNILKTIALDWQPGNTLIYVPNYNQLLRVNFWILRQKVTTNFLKDAAVHVLHDQTSHDEYLAMVEDKINGINIIIATDIAESVAHDLNITYVIDTARTERTIYNGGDSSVKTEYEWISEQRMKARAVSVDGTNGNRATVIRLIPEHITKELHRSHQPEVTTIPLERICLFIKFLSPHKMVAKYLENSILRPPFANVNLAIGVLKKMSLLDANEDPTWLACRIIDIPVECHLAKLILFSILLECFDPILTIVSFLTVSDPLQFLQNDNEKPPSSTFKIDTQVNSGNDKGVKNTLSDHFRFLLIYHNWQNNFRENGNNSIENMNECQFMLNGMLERISNVRNFLVGMLRSVRLIHNQGSLSMHLINSKADNFAIIRATLVGGLYPRLCLFDTLSGSMKSTKAKRLRLCAVNTNKDSNGFASPWLVYNSEQNGLDYNLISICTSVTPISVALFAGHMHMSPSNIVCSKLKSNSMHIASANLYIDDWIWFTSNKDIIYTIFKVRQMFFNKFNYYLRNCTDPKKMEIYHLKDFLHHLDDALTQEEQIYNFPRYKRLRLRPKAIPAFLQSMNKSVSALEKVPIKEKNAVFTQKSNHLTENYQFFIIILPFAVNEDFEGKLQQWLSLCSDNFVKNRVADVQLLQIFFYSVEHARFEAVCTAERRFNNIFIHKIRRTTVSLFKYRETLSKYTPLPAIIRQPTENISCQAIDNFSGQLLLSLFGANSGSPI